MQLYIRGAWRTFNPKAEQDLGQPASSRDTVSIRNTRDKVEALPGSVADGRSRDSCHSSPKLVTTNMLSMKMFYTVLAGRRPLSDEDSKCLVRLDDKQEIWIVRTEADCGEPTKYSPKRDMNIQRRGVEELIMLYDRCRRAGISVNQTGRSGSLMQIFDPEGNIVNTSIAPDALSSMALLDHDGSSTTATSQMRSEVEGLSEDCESQGEELKADVERKESSPVHIKSEPAMTE